MIGLYVQKEYSVDDFHKDKERVFMMEIPSDKLVIFPDGLMDALLLDFPQIEKGARVLTTPDVISIPDKEKLNMPIMIADK